MDNRKMISSENPVYLYKLVKSSNEDAHNGKFKEFIVTKAWQDEHKSNDEQRDYLYFTYYQNGRLIRGTKVNKKFGIPYTTPNSYNVWFYHRNDKEALRQVHLWLRQINYKFRNDIREKAKKLLTELEFASNLNSVEDSDIYESKS